MNYEKIIKSIKSKKGKFNGKELDYVLKALDSENSEHKEIDWLLNFEESFAKTVGSKYSIAVNSGTSGLHAALFAAGISEGDEVIQPALTVIMDAYATIHLGGVPVFVDSDKSSWNIDPDLIESKITKKTKAILTVSWFGLPVNMEPIMKIAKKHNLLVIDDSAETFHAYYKTQFSGSNADIGVYSFENKKHLTSGSEGGMVVTNNEKLATLVRKFAGIGYKHMTASAGRTHLAKSTFQDPNYFRFDTIGLNYRMNSISAAVGLAQLERSEAIVNRRKSNAKYFIDAINGCTWLVPQKFDNKLYEHSYYTFAVLYKGDEIKGILWKEFYNQYKAAGGDGFYGNVAIPYLEPALLNKKYGRILLERGLCPVAEGLQQKVMAFKTNYRDVDSCIKQANLLKKIIDKIGRK